MIHLAIPQRGFEAFPRADDHPSLVLVFLLKVRDYVRVSAGEHRVSFREGSKVALLAGGALGVPPFVIAASLFRARQDPLFFQILGPLNFCGLKFSLVMGGWSSSL